MFLTRDVWMVIKKATLTIAEDNEGVERRMAEVALVLDPFPMPLARELGEDVADHIFTPDGALRQEVSSITLDPRVPQQCMHATSAVGHPGTDIRNVDIDSLAVAKQEDKQSGKVWFRATFKARFDLGPKVNREWLVRYFGLGLNFSFDAEQLGLLPETSMRDVVRKAVTDMDEQSVKNFQRNILSGCDSVEMTTIDPKTGQRVGTRITKDGAEPIGGAV